MSKRLGLNLFTSIIYQLVLLVTGFIIPNVILNVYGSTLNGLVSSITQIIGYLSIVEAGLGGASVFALYGPLVNKDVTMINRIVSTTKSLYTSAGNLFSGLLIIFAVVYSLGMKINDLSTGALFILIVALGFKGIFDFYALSKYQALLTADNKLYVIQMSFIGFQVINTFLIVFISLWHLSIVVVYSASLLPLIFRSFFLNLYVKKRYEYLDTSLNPEKELMSDRWNVLFLNIVQSVQGAGPVVIVSFMVGLREVSVYTIYNVVFSGLIAMLTMLTNSVQSYFGSMIALHEKSVSLIFRKFNLFFTQVVSVISAVSLIMIVSFIELYIGKTHSSDYFSKSFGLLMSVNMLFIVGKAPTGMLVMAAGHYQQTRVQSALQAIILLVLGTVLSKFYGLNGVIIGSILSNAYRWVELIFYVPRKIFQEKNYMYIKDSFAMILTYLITAIVLDKLGFWSTNIGRDTWLLRGFESLMLGIMVSAGILILLNIKQLLNRIVGQK